MPHLGYLRGEPVLGRAPELHGGGWQATAVRHLRRWRRRRQLESYRLAGHRSPGSLRLLLASDVSGSMTPFAAAREEAITRFLDWVVLNLRPDDEIGLLQFSDRARWVLLPVRVDDLADGLRRDADLDGGATLWTPVVDKVARLAESGSRTVLWLLSDGQYPDYPHDCDLAGRVLQQAGIASTALLVPSHDIEVPDAWSEVFPGSACVWFDGRSRDQTALALAQAAAQATGQRLVVVP